MAKMVLKGKKWFKNLQISVKWSQNVQYGPKWSKGLQMVLNGLKKIKHKFDRMAFITRLNLVLVWPKIVQIVTKKSSKWVLHNQVSWSSFCGP